MTQEEKQSVDETTDVKKEVAPPADKGSEGTGGAAGGYGGPADETENAYPTSTEPNHES
jgi:hypothetical protein